MFFSGGQGRSRGPRPALRHTGTKAVRIGEAGYAWCGRKTPPCPGCAARLRRNRPEKGVARPVHSWPRAGPVPPGLPLAAPFRAPGSRGGRRPTLTETILSAGNPAKPVQTPPARKAKRAGFPNVRQIAQLGEDFKAADCRLTENEAGSKPRPRCWAWAWPNIAVENNQVIGQEFTQGVHAPYRLCPAAQRAASAAGSALASPER